MHPVGTHHALAARALAAGKHVFVESPSRLLNRCARAGGRLRAAADLVLMPGHTFLYSPPVTLSRELIQSGQLGDVYFITTSRVNLGLHQPDVSVVWDLGTSRLLDPALLAGGDAGQGYRRSAEVHG